MSEDTKMIMEELAKIHGRLDKMDGRLDKMDRRMDELESSTKQEIRSLKTYMENEIETKINIVAEGHFDLMRKFRQVQLCNEEWEMMKIRVLALERGVREIKEKMQVA